MITATKSVAQNTTEVSFVKTSQKNRWELAWVANSTWQSQI